MKGSLTGDSLYEAALLFSEIAEKDDGDIQPDDAGDIRFNCERLLKYFKQCLKDHSIEKEKTREGIKNVVFLCTEAAKKVDKFQQLLKKPGYKNILESPEYRRLQSFYLKKISKTIDEGTLGKWILTVSKELWGKERRFKTDSESKYVFIDLEGVKNDSEYELFFIKKEDGSRFFSPKLLKNIKLVSNLISDRTSETVQDPLIDIHVWKERALYSLALEIYNRCESSIRAFYKLNYKNKESDLIADLKKCLIALFLASRLGSLSHENGKKCVADYFNDFLMFFNKICSSSEYYTITHYPSHKRDKHLAIAINLLQDIGKALYLGKFHHSFEPLLRYVIQTGDGHDEAYEPLSAKIAHNYKALASALKNHANGCLSKIVDNVESNHLNKFEPLFDDNIPCDLFKINIGDREISNIRLPCPTVQEYIHQAKLSDLFKILLKTLQRDHVKYLLINLQDRTSWKEASRSHVLEINQDSPEYENTLFCTTLSLDSSFYNQSSLFEKQNKVGDFLKSFENELLNTNNHYYCDTVRPSLEIDVPNILQAVHTLFFHDKNVLTKIERCQFIDIAYLFIIFKHLEIISPHYMSLVCKDGLDSSAALNCLIEIFLHFLSSDEIEEKAMWQIMNNLFSPTLISRERAPFKEKIQRMIHTLKAIESIRDEHGAEKFRKLLKAHLMQYS